MQNIYLDSESIKTITQNFFELYKNKNTNKIDIHTTEKLICDIYKSMGIKNYYQKKDGEDFLNTFSSPNPPKTEKTQNPSKTNKNRISAKTLTYTDLEKLFFRYLSGKPQTPPSLSTSFFVKKNFSESKKKIFKFSKKQKLQKRDFKPRRRICDFEFEKRGFSF